MDHPKLRPIEAFPVNISGREVICLRDPSQLTEVVVFVPHEALFVLAHFDGQHSLLDVQEAFARRYGQLLYSDTIKNFITRLDEHLLLDNDHFHSYKRPMIEDFRKAPFRQAYHAGTAYAADPHQLEAQLASYFTDPEGPSTAGALPVDAVVQGIVAPHIDPRRGGPCFAWAYEAVRRATADLFIIFGTAHQPTSVPFPLTLKDYTTPFGLVETDKEFVRALARRYPTDLLSDEIAHRTEHSIEFQALFLRYILGPTRRFRLVPSLVGSFHECVQQGIDPAEMRYVADFIDIIREVAERVPKQFVILWVETSPMWV
jgi:AmmeMemoRadiSam system protein B